MFDDKLLNMLEENFNNFQLDLSEINDDIQEGCICGDFIQISDKQQICGKCSAIYDVSEDISIDQKKIRKQWNYQGKCFDSQLSKMIQQKGFDDKIIMSAQDTAPLVPVHIIKQAIEDLRSVQDLISIKGKNLIRLVAYRISQLCSQQSIKISKEQIFKIVNLKGDTTLYQGGKIYSDYLLLQKQSPITEYDLDVQKYYPNIILNDSEITIANQIIKQTESSSIFIQFTNISKIKSVMSIIFYQRLLKSNGETHDQHQQRSKIKYDVCWQCFVYELKKIDTTIKKFKTSFDILQSKKHLLTHDLQEILFNVPQM